MNHQKYIQKAINFIEDNLDQTFSLKDISNEAFKSLSYMHRIFYCMTGYTMKEYIRNRRLSDAAYQLRCSDSKITDIALRAGFKTHESFTRAFFKKYEISPRDFRKNRQEQVLFEPLNVELAKHNNQNRLSELNLEVEYVLYQETPVCGFQISTTLDNGQQAIDIPNFAGGLFSSGQLQKYFDLLYTPVFGVYTNMSENNNFNYLVGCLASCKKKKSEEMITHHIKDSKYARFRLRQNDLIKEAWQYIYGVWFLEQTQLRTKGFDFEIYYETHTDIYIPMNY